MNPILVYVTSSFGTFFATSAYILSKSRTGRLAGSVLLLFGSSAFAIHLSMHYMRNYQRDEYDKSIRRT